MAEIVVSAFLSVLFEKLASEAFKKIALAKAFDSDKLESSLIKVQNLLNAAAKREIADATVKRWLNDLQHLAYDIDDLLDDLATEAMGRELKKESGATTSKVRKLIPTCCTNISLSAKLHRKLDDISTKLQELVEGKSNPGLSVIPNETPKYDRYEGSLSLVAATDIVGREDVKKALLQKLLGGNDESCKQNFSIVPIIGMGGVGKTTLARILFDEKEVVNHFKLMVWVCVAGEFDISNISKVIYQKLTGENKEFADLNLLQEALKEKLKDILFLIVLDDVWSESQDHWDKLVAPLFAGAPGSRIIMTTRKENLLKSLRCDNVNKLEKLSHDDCYRMKCFDNA